MRIDIPSLETLKVLDFAKHLNELVLEEEVTLNPKMKWVRPFGMLVAAISIKQLRDNHAHIPFNIEPNNNKDGVSYASHMGFFKSISARIDLGKEPGEAMGNDNYIPITEIEFPQLHDNGKSNEAMLGMGDDIELKAGELSKILSRDNKEMHKLITYLIREILRNIPEHSESNKAWICGQYWMNGTAEIAIVDEGIGVKNSLRRNSIHKKYIITDEDAITCSLKAGISQAFQPSKSNSSNHPWANSGFGLYMVSEICKELQGSFCLASGEKFINISHSGKHIIGDTSFRGTAVKISISTQNLGRSQDIIKRISSQGEAEAKTIRNAFKKASGPSKELMNIFE